MLLRASESERERERNIYESANAILFLGTPHRGGNFVDLGETARRIVSAVGFDTSHQNIRDLAIDSQTLEDYHERFLKLYNRRKFEICTFQEGRGMKGTSILGLNQKV
jgi:ankyrin repeat domain-containing protein 50